MPKKNNNNKDIEEIENAFRDLSQQSKPKAGKYANKKNGRLRLILPICIAAAVVIAVVGGVLFFTSQHNNKQITANVSIAGCDVTGLSRSEAEQKVTEHLNALYATTDMTGQVDDQSVIIPYSVSQVQVDVEAAVDAAIQFANSDSAVTPLDLSPYIQINRTGVMEKLQSFTPHFNSKLTQTTYKISGTVPEFVDKIDENANCTVLVCQRLNTNAYFLSRM